VRRWWPWLVLSAILHLPFTPLGPLLGLLTLLVRLHAGVPAEPVEELVGIPVELLAEPAPAAPQPTAIEGDAVVIAPTKPNPPKPEPEPKDAGVPDAAVDGGVEAGVADAGVTSDGGLGDASVPAGLGDAGTEPAPVDAGAPKPDPFAIAGELGRFQKGNVNVRVHLFAEPLKRHPAGALVAGLLAREPQWQEFLGPSGIDPLSDFSKIVIMGPQLVDSSQVGVFLEYKGDAGAMRKAVDALVQRTEGARWEIKKKKPVAYLHAAGGDRVIVLYPNHGVAIVPPKPSEQMIALSKFPTMAAPTRDDEILQLLLRNPYRVRAFKRAGIDVPRSISLAKVFVSGSPNGGAQIRLELEDESPEAATAHAPDLEQALAKVSMGMLSLRLDCDGATIRGEANLSPIIVGGILREVQKRFLPKTANP
jgi:hypothetical protein